MKGWSDNVDDGYADDNGDEKEDDGHDFDAEHSNRLTDTCEYLTTAVTKFWQKKLWIQ